VVAGAAIGMLLATLYVPGIVAAFHFSALSAGEIGVALAFGSASIFWYESIKFIARYRRDGSGDMM
jgi:hypothetical protein